MGGVTPVAKLVAFHFLIPSVFFNALSKVKVVISLILSGTIVKFH